jgi:hypothetical protein
MVRVVDEDVVALRGAEHGALRRFFVSSEHREELRGRDVLARVARLASMINVLAVGLVEDLARDRVLRAVGDVVVHEQYNLPLGDALALRDLVGVAGVGLVAVVAVAVASGHDDGPVVLPGGFRQHEGVQGRRGEREEYAEASHSSCAFVRAWLKLRAQTSRVLQTRSADA